MGRFQCAEVAAGFHDTFGRCDPARVCAMTDTPEIPVEVIEGELLPVKRKRGRPKTGRKPPDKYRAGAPVSEPKHRRVAWLKSARVLDVEQFQRLRATGAGARKLSKALGCSMLTAQKMMNGRHWQQDAEKVAAFNRFHGASLDPATGVPTAGDLGKHGGAYALATKYTSAGEKELREIVENTGTSAGMLDTAMRRMRILAGAQKEGDLPAEVDTKWLQDSIDRTLGVIMTLMDPITLAGASVADLTRAASMLLEKRALLRGEPTSIVRNEHRGKLDELGGVLLGELQKRGITLDMPKSGYREVTNG
jgi:hypothetical protein